MDLLSMILDMPKVSPAAAPDSRIPAVNETGLPVVSRERLDEVVELLVQIDLHYQYVQSKTALFKGLPAAHSFRDEIINLITSWTCFDHPTARLIYDTAMIKMNNPKYRF